MPAKIISFANSKGGSAKTTSCMSMGAELADRGYRVLIVDCDHQATATQWSTAAPDHAPFPATVINLAHFAAKVHREIERHVLNYEFILIDCPSSLENPILQSAVFSSDLVIIPTRPSLADVWSSQAVNTLIERAAQGNEQLQATFLPTMVTRTSLSTAMLDALGELGLPVMKASLSNRIAFQEAVVTGTTVSRLGRSGKSAAEEVKAMTDEVLEILGRKK